MRKSLSLFLQWTAAFLFLFALQEHVRPQGAAAPAPESAAPEAGGPADGSKTEEPTDQSSPDSGAGDTDDAVSEEQSDFGIGDDKVEAIIRSLRGVVGWVERDSWLVIGDAGGEKWPLKIIHSSPGANREIGEGMLHVAGPTTLKVSLAISTEDGTQEIEDFAPVVNVEWFDILDEAASVAVSEGLARLGQPDPDKQVLFVWVGRKEGAKRWPVRVHEFFGPRILPGYAEVDSATTMVLVYPARMM
jgi:hypothetical protein